MLATIGLARGQRRVSRQIRSTENWNMDRQFFNLNNTDMKYFYWFLILILIGCTGVLSSCSQQQKYPNAHEMYATSDLNIRKGPGTNFEILKTVRPNTALLTTDSISSNGFVMVLNSDRTKLGWVSKKYLRSEPVTLSVGEKKEKIDNSETLEFQVTKNVTKVGLPYQNRAKIEILVLVDSIPTDEAMRRTATRIWQNGNKGWDEFTVFIDLPKAVMMDFLNLPYGTYGVFEFTPSGLNEKASTRH